MSMEREAKSAEHFTHSFLSLRAPLQLPRGDGNREKRGWRRGGGWGKGRGRAGGNRKGRGQECSPAALFSLLLLSLLIRQIDSYSPDFFNCFFFFFYNSSWRGDLLNLVIAGRAGLDEATASEGNRRSRKRRRCPLEFFFESGNDRFVWKVLRRREGTQLDERLFRLARLDVILQGGRSIHSQDCSPRREVRVTQLKHLLARAMTPIPLVGARHARLQTSQLMTY